MRELNNHRTRGLLAFLVLIGFLLANVAPVCLTVIDLNIAAIEFLECEEKDLQEEEKGEETKEHKDVQLLIALLHGPRKPHTLASEAYYSLLFNSLHAQEIPTPPPDQA